ncbi:hypothetical protein TWF696_005518 [Orbilia brochopaga]|uniref:Cysteine-rich transmembrane CYSTM domain-containing protein n=1 Tax=Orbilia brochopaga TaxID=3140254 RepID=A0AAV9V433_9PEZI
MSSQDYYQQTQQPSYPQQAYGQQQPPQYQQGYGQPPQGYYPPQQQGGMQYQQQYDDDRGHGGSGAQKGCLAGLCLGLCACCACEGILELIECCFFCC